MGGHEADISAKYHQAQAHTWLSCTYENKRRTRNLAASSHKRSHAPLRLTQAATRYSLPKSHRLLRTEEFTAVIDNGRRTRDLLFTVYCAPNRLTHARLGMIVSRRVSSKATVRNRIRRYIREAFRHEQEQLAGLDIVVAAQPPAAYAEAARLRKALVQHWRSIATRLR